MTRASTTTGPPASPPRSPLRRRLVTTVVVSALLAATVTTLYQPWLTQWGSTADERRGAVAGDDLVADSDSTWTRSITIDAPPAEVWSWLVQIGEGRGGFYNYDWGEQLFLDPIHNTTTIHPEWQTLRAGDVVHPKPGSDWRVAEVRVQRALVLENPLVSPTDWTWATELRPLEGGRTRVVTRIRSEKGTFFSYALDVPDLILFPRLLTGLKQRAEGTLPGMPGTRTGGPFPIARLPVHVWAAGAWILALAVLASLGRRRLGLGSWRRMRAHPHLVFWVGFVAGAGYLLMSDTPPIQFLSHSWAAGLVLAATTGLLGRRMVATALPVGGRRRPVSRGLSAFVEAGLFVVLPVTATWHAATALGWTGGPVNHVLVGGVGALLAGGVASRAWAPASGRGAAAFALVLATGYALTGSAVVPLLGAILAELLPGGHGPLAPVDATDQGRERLAVPIGSRA